MSQLEGLTYYLLMQSEDSRIKLARNGYDQTTQQDLMQWLDPEVIALGNYMLEFNRANGKKIDKLHREVKNIGIGLVENYFTALYETSLTNANEQSLDGSEAAGSALRGAGFLKRRQAHSSRPQRVNALAIFRGHARSTNHWLTHIETADKWGTVLKNNEVNRVIRDHIGEGFATTLQTEWNVFEEAGVRNQRATLAGETLAQKIVNNTTLAILGARLSTIMVNLSAVTNATGEVGTLGLIRGARSIIMNPERAGVFKEVWNSDAMKIRLKEGSNYAAQQVKQTSSGISSNGSRFIDKPIFTKLNRLAQYGMVPIGYADAFANTLTLGLAYENAYEQMKSEGKELAKQYAEAEVARLIGRTAQPTQDLALSATERNLKSNVFSALLARFLSEPRKNAALNLEALRKLTTGKGRGNRVQAAERLAYTWAVYTAVESLLRSLYEELFKEEDEEKGLSRLSNPKYWLYKLSAGQLGAIPFYGEGINAVIAPLTGERVYDTSNNPLMRIAKEPFSAVKTLLDDGATPGEKADEIIDLLQVEGGLAFPLMGQIGNVLEAGKGFAENTLGVEWSEADRIANTIEEYRELKKRIDDQAKEGAGVSGLLELPNYKQHKRDRAKLMKDFLELHTEDYTEEMKANLAERI